MDRTNPWLTRSNPEIAAGWIEAWWIEARSHADSDRARRRKLQESDPVRFAAIELSDHDPARALDVAFLIARASDNPWLIMSLGVAFLQEPTRNDPTLWDAVGVEAANNPSVLYALAWIEGAEVPDELWNAYRRLESPYDWMDRNSEP